MRRSKEARKRINKNGIKRRHSPNMIRKLEFSSTENKNQTTTIINRILNQSPNQKALPNPNHSNN